MDAFFSRVEDLIKTLLNPDGLDRGARGRSADSDYSVAWDELEDYLREREPGASSRSRTTAGAASGARSGAAPEEDYRNLELEPGADFESVKRAYRRLMRTYHPDRFAADPKRQPVATEISAKLNASFNRIRAAQERT